MSVIIYIINVATFCHVMVINSKCTDLISFMIALFLKDIYSEFFISLSNKIHEQIIKMSLLLPEMKTSQILSLHWQ